LESAEGPALGAAVAARWGLEHTRRRECGISEQFCVHDAVAAMVKYRETIQPNSAWTAAYRRGLGEFDSRVKVHK
jgi:hypothetical protein